MSVRVENLHIERSGRVLIDGAGFAIGTGEVIGIVGRNGAGKSTMLKTLAGDRHESRGRIEIIGSLGYLPQDTPRVDDAGTALRYVLAARGFDVLEDKLEKARIAMEESPTDEAITAFTDAQMEFSDKGGYAAEADAFKIASALGLGEDRMHRSMDALSGGERRRVELTRLLFGDYDVLMLDEPTNHLDQASKDWLINFLGTTDRTLLVISHDLELLDSHIDRVLHVDNATVTVFRGTYSQYLVSSEEARERIEKQADRDAREVKRIKDQADSMRGSSAKRARKAKVLDRQAEKLEANVVVAPKKQKTIKIRLPNPSPPARVVLEAVGLGKRYGSTRALSGVDLVVERNERYVVLGHNGAGKSTLLRSLYGMIDPDEGAFEWGRDVRLGYFDQEHGGIDVNKTPLEHLEDTAIDSDRERRALLGSLGLGKTVDQAAGTLSGGEKTKLSLAVLMAGGPNVLLLDEPTNHLDPPARDAVAEMLAGWKGTFILVSHDPVFIETVAPTRVLRLPETLVDHWRDDFLDYASELELAAEA